MESTIRVQKVILSSGEERWVVLDESGELVVPIMKFIKYKDALGKAPNTLKTYCYHLKLFWAFLSEKNKHYKEGDLNLLAEFIGWLRRGSNASNTVYLAKGKKSIEVAKRTESSINSILNCIVEFYDFQWRNGEVTFDMKLKATKEIKITKKKYRRFLDHTVRSRTTKINILKLKEAKRKVKTVTNEQAEMIYKACSNLRDQLIIRIMYEGGLRASELLSLWIEDFSISDCSITVRESKTKTGEKRKVYVSKETMNLFQDYIIDYHTAGTDSNYVFINIKGKNSGKLMNYWTLQALIRRLSKKTNIDFTAHMLRHTYATNLYDLGIKAGIIQKLLGHSQVQTTLNMYIHPSEETIRKHWEQAKQHGRIQE